MTTQVMNVSVARHGIIIQPNRSVGMCVYVVREGWAGVWLQVDEVSQLFPPPCSMTFLMAEGPTTSQLSMAFPTAVYTHIHELNVCFLNIQVHALYMQYMSAAIHPVQFTIKAIVFYSYTLQLSKQSVVKLRKRTVRAAHMMMLQWFSLWMHISHLCTYRIDTGNTVTCWDLEFKKNICSHTLHKRYVITLLYLDSFGLFVQVRNMYTYFSATIFYLRFSKFSKRIAIPLS